MHAPHPFQHTHHEHGPGYWFVVMAALIILFGGLLAAMLWLSAPDGPSSNNAAGISLLQAS